MEATTPILARFSLRGSCGVSPLPPFSSHPPTAIFPPISAATSLCFKSSASPNHVPLLRSRLPDNPKNIKASSSGIASTNAAERWILEPIGDGDFRHIGFKVPMPGAFVIASTAVTIGRVPENADVVLPVATVSALHARLEQKDGVLLVTDLDSTNGTFVDGKKLRSGAVTAVPPGSVIVFGDAHLAMFRVLKVDNVVVSNESEETGKGESEAETPVAKI